MNKHGFISEQVLQSEKSNRHKRPCISENVRKNNVQQIFALSKQAVAEVKEKSERRLRERTD